MGLFDGTPLARPVLCEQCGQDIKLCGCPPPDTPPDKQQLKIRLEKRKRGKIVTVIAGFTCSTAQCHALLTSLKNECGAGGCVEGQLIELQGDHLARLPASLRARGYRVP
jgi:translation initiation factor 1